METNELPEAIKAKIEQYGRDQSVSPSDEFFIKRDVEFGYRLALQSKEEELNRFKKEIELLKLESDNAWSKLKAKDEQIKGLINRRVGHTVLDGLYEEQKSTIDSLTSENNELKKRLSEIEKPT